MKLRLVGDIRFVLLKTEKPAEAGRLLSYSKLLRGHFFASLEVEEEEPEELDVFDEELDDESEVPDEGFDSVPELPFFLSAAGAFPPPRA
jgi:hypothetical protein